MQKTFGDIDASMSKFGVLWDKCVSLGVATLTSVNVGCYSSVIVKARKKKNNIILMGFSCHITHNATKKTKDAFSKIDHFTIGKVLLDVFFHFDYSFKRKVFLLNLVISMTRTMARF